VIQVPPYFKCGVQPAQLWHQLQCRHAELFLSLLTTRRETGGFFGVLPGRSCCLGREVVYSVMGCSIRKNARAGFTWLRRVLFFIMLPAFAGCSSTGQRGSGMLPLSGNPPKYIFFFIGDGMGPAQVELAGVMREEGCFSVMKSLPVSGTVSTTASDRYITDSGAAGTALATGSKTSVGTIAMSADHRDTLRTVAEMAKAKGMKVGIVSSVGIDNATPACFYAHQTGRESYYAIALQMASSGFDYFGGGYAEGNFPENRKKAEKDRGDILDLMQQAGYTVTTDRMALASVLPGTKSWALTVYDGKAAMSFAIDRQPHELSLAEVTRQGIRLLDNPQGFFMMVEGGRIDWACHANDAASAGRDVEAFEDAISEALAFYRRHCGETLIVVTADHECGGLSLGNGAGGYGSRFRLLGRQKISLKRFADKVASWRETREVTFPMALDSVRAYYGLGDTSSGPALAMSSGDRQVLRDAFRVSMKRVQDGAGPGDADLFSRTVTRLLNTRAGIGWTSNSHTGAAVQVFAVGRGAAEFSGFQDNTDIAKKIMRIAGLRERRPRRR